MGFSVFGGMMATVAGDGIVELQRRLLGGYQLLQTLVGIRLRSVTDPQSVRHLTWLSDVTAAVELISRRMTVEGPLDFAGYLGEVAAFWTRACEGRPVRLDVRGQSALLPDSHLLPLAIITHELISNACRHAFPDNRRGSIAVAFSRAVGGVSLVVRDSGIGAATLEPGEGLRLVRGLVEHLGGSMTIETAPEAGVGVRIRLPLESLPSH
ncbi:sensor histidine kinase [Brevundimonas sp.]|uniref:sensor histidine kinase n=1 Tax=Brevundimonas sp. TaxID=1871086 RepID=UPI002D4BE92B|nr:sensor histidine kinase [Brevundimonas sp.]HYD28194.1 sensor histidine kinase [Brevundimonas sp.]